MTMGFVCVSADFIFETTRQIYKKFSMGKGCGGGGGVTAAYPAIFLCVRTITRKYIWSNDHIDFHYMS